MLPAVVAACGGGSPAGDAGPRDGARADAGDWWVGLRSLAIDPPMVTLQGSPTASTTQQFTVTGTYTNGTHRDLSTAVTYDLRPSGVGAIDRNGLFTTNHIGGGQANLTVRSPTASDVTATAQITVRWTAAQVGTGVPADIADQFGHGTPDSDTHAAPDLVYPNDGTLFPPNLSQLEVHWKPPANGAQYYDLAFSNAITDVHLYATCTMMGGGCVQAFDTATWHWIAETNRGAAPLTLTVRALAANGHVGASSAVTLRFAADDVQGGIYYWTAASDTNGIYRYDFTRGDTAPQPFYTKMMTPQVPMSDDGEPNHPCTGCHALSGDGTHLATVLGGSGPAYVVELDVASRNITAQHIDTPFAQLLSYSPDATRLVASHNGAMSLLNANNLSAAGALDTGGLGTHPDWSPNGNGIVFTHPIDQRNSIWVHRGAIGWLPAMGNDFAAAQTLVPAQQGENHYYPSVSPDGRYVVYNRSACPGGDETSDQCDAYDDPTAALWLVDTGLPMHSPIALAHANARGATDTGDALTNSWPRVSPFTTHLDGNTVYWVTFSSKRNYGVRLTTGDRPQLWMVAVAVPDTEVPSPVTQDPSYAAFWLPFQSIDTGNHIAQWTRAIVAIGDPGVKR